LNSEMIWKIWKKSKLNGEKIWKMQKRNKFSNNFHIVSLFSWLFVSISMSLHYSTCLFSIFSISFLYSTYF
jgi:hypothetical protein